MPAKLLGLIAAAALLLLAASAEAAPEKRVALIIGNSAYQNVAKLTNPANDANAMAQMFRSAGFSSVTTRQDLGVLEFKRALREFFDAAQDADIAVVFYAGHGIQVGDMNYMIPVDARLATELDVQDEAVSLDRILVALQPARQLRLVILDACRENPFLNRMKVANATRSMRTRGLARVEPENSSLVAYAAKGGQIAQDGSGEHSPFTTALLKHLPSPGLDIRLALGRVRDDVLKSTAGKQEPFVYGSLGGDSVAIVPAPAEPKRDMLTDVKGDYELVERIGTQKAWEVFLTSHKDGLYAELARAQLAKLLQAEGKPVPARPAASAETPPSVTIAAVPPTTPPSPSPAFTRERIDWELVKDSGDRAKLRDFLARYPSSPLAETARNRLDAIEREEKARAEQQARITRPQIDTSPQQEESCSRDEQKLALLRAQATQGWAQEDLRRLQRTTACARIRAEAAALVVQPAGDTSRAATTSLPPQLTTLSPQTTNVLEPVLSAIGDLRQLGCLAVQSDPALSGAISDAIRRYLAEKGRSEEDIKTVEKLVADMTAENERLCGGPCAQGERRDGDRCVTDAKPETKPTAQETTKPVLRPRNEPERPRRKSQSSREEPRRTAGQSKADRVTSGPATVRSEASVASRVRHSGTIGVGF